MYLEQVKTTKNETAFKEHEAAVTRLVYTLGQAALSELLSQYDASCEMISVGEQTYGRKHKAPKEYQTALGPVTIERHLFFKRKKEGDAQSLCPLLVRLVFLTQKVSVYQQCSMVRCLNIKKQP